MRARKTVFVFWFWYFLILGTHPTVVGPYRTETQCQSYRAQLESFSGGYDTLACWDDGVQNTLRK
jgi:hypothetical protein